MKIIRSLFVACLVCLVVLASLAIGSIGVLSAQITTGSTVRTSPQGASQTTTTPREPDSRDRFQGFEERRYLGPVFRFGVPYSLNAGAEISEAVIIFGDATIDGRVDGNVAVVLGDLRIGATAVIEGTVVNIGGVATIADGAAIRDDLVIVAGRLNASPSFSPLGQHVVIGPPSLGDRLRGVVPWLTTGLLWGRVIVPSLPWMWPLIGISLVVFLIVGAAFPKGVQACAATLSTRPLSSFFAGILTLLLIGPISAILAVSVVGVIVIPFALCAVVIGWVLGKVGVAEWIGAGIVRSDEPAGRGQALLAMLIGFAIITLVYMVPGIGLAAWALVGVFGLGTATLSFFAALRRERPEPKKKPTPPVTPPPAPPSSSSHGGDTDLPLRTGDSLHAPMASSASAPGAVAYAVAGEAGAGTTAAPAMPAARTYVEGDLRAYARAMFLDRVGAVVLDFLLVFITYQFLDLHDEGFFYVIALAYYVAFLTWKGTTVGGIICSLRVIRVDGQPLRPVDAIVRTLSSLFSIAAAGIGFFWILLQGNVDRQAWHDKIAGTLVVRVPRDFPV